MKPRNFIILFFLFASFGSFFAQTCPTGLGNEFPFNCYFDATSGASLHEFLNSSELTGSGCLSGDSDNILIENTEITINGDLLIESNAVFNNVIINMTEGSSIKIDAIPWIWGDLTLIPDVFNNNIIANEVEFINGTVIRGCDHLWQGFTFSTQENVAGPTVRFTGSSIEDAYKAITTGDRANIHITGTTFNDNYIAVSANTYHRLDVDDCTIQGLNGLKTPYLGLVLNSTFSWIGIETGLLNSNFPFFLGTFANANTFNNLKFGITNGISFNTFTDRFRIRDQTFNNVDICVQIKDANNIDINGNSFNYNNIGVEVLSARPNSSVSIGSISSNNFQCTSLGIGFSAIDLQNLNDVFELRVRNNNISGRNLFGINMDHGRCYFANVRDNVITDAYLGIGIKNFTSPYGYLNVAENFINSDTDQLIRGVYLSSTNNVSLVGNIITDLNTSGYSFKGISLNDRSTYNLLKENEVYAQDMKIGIGLSQSGFNNLCCNISDGQTFGLDVLGTSPNNQIRNTFFETNSLQLTQSSIGTQDHNGNRWIDSGTIGILNNTDLDDGVSFNQFNINTLENFLPNILVKPEDIIPDDVEFSWFRDISQGSSSLCGSNQYLNCNFPFIPEINIVPPIGYTPGLCAPQDLDSDNDGICDSVDPDPLDSCIPNAVDTDGDGLCDPVDPDPFDACQPFFQDTDGDGVCDVVDSFILDPCLPNGNDVDNDGVCSNFDPDDNDPSVPVKPLSVDPIIKDIKDNYYSSNNTTGIPYRSLNQVEEQLNHSYGTHNFEVLNDWEDKFSVYDFLLGNQYYLSISVDLNNFWSDKSNQSEIWDYVVVHNDIKNYTSLNVLENNSLIKNNLYIDRLDKMLDYYNSNYDSLKVTILEANRDLIKIENDIIYANHAQCIQNKLVEIHGKINSLPGNEIFHTTQKSVWLKELIHVQNGLDVLDLDYLKTVAYECPLEYGPAVFEAQALLLQYDDLDLNNISDLCSYSFPRSEMDREQIEDSDITIFPNPGYDMVTIQSEIPMKSIEILDNGRLVSSQKMALVKEVKVDISNLRNGMYQFKIIRMNDRIIRNVIKIK